VIAQDATTITYRSPFGGIRVTSRAGSSIAQTLKHDVEPDRASWERFSRHLDPADPSRWQPGWEKVADRLNARDHMTCFFGGTLYGWARDWLGVEAISCLAYEDPVLFEDIIAFLADYVIALNTPLLKRVSFDFAYIFEDCCFKSGPLISPAMYRKFYDRHYRRMIAAYRDLGVPLVLIDSDGKVDDLLPCWLETGFDIVFPIEIGTWRADPTALRRQHGPRLRMMGGVDKLVIPRGEAAIRAELEPLRGLAAEGGFLPMPDHRIPPDVSLAQFETYLRVFREVFGEYHPS
jgi:uroporphyrinogen decarboxylase